MRTTNAILESNSSVFFFFLNNTYLYKSDFYSLLKISKLNIAIILRTDQFLKNYNSINLSDFVCLLKGSLNKVVVHEDTARGFFTLFLSLAVTLLSSNNSNF